MEAVSLSGAAPWLLQATWLTSHNTLTEFIIRASLQKKSQTYLEPSYLPAWAGGRARAHAHSHTHTSAHLSEQEQYSIDWEGQADISKGWKYEEDCFWVSWCSPVSTLTSSQSRDRFAVAAPVGVPGFGLLWHPSPPPGRFKEYQQLFPDFPQEVQTQVRTVYRKPSKNSSMQIQESQVSAEASEDKTRGTRKPLPRHRRPYKSVSLLAYSVTRTTTLWGRLLKPHFMKEGSESQRHGYSGN